MIEDRVNAKIQALAGALDDMRTDKKESEAVHWIFHCPPSDINWKGALKRLTDREIVYCLERMKLKTGIRQLKVEARKRGLTPPCCADHPRMQGIRCNREDKHPGEHCRQRLSHPEGYDNIWWQKEGK